MDDGSVVGLHGEPDIEGDCAVGPECHPIAGRSAVKCRVEAVPLERDPDDLDDRPHARRCRSDGRDGSERRFDPAERLEFDCEIRPLTLHHQRVWPAG